MRLWAKALCRFILFVFKPLRHVESIWGWVELIVQLLLMFGIGISAYIGIINKSNRYLLTIVALSLVTLLFLCAGVRLQYRLLRAFSIRILSFHSHLLAPDPFEGVFSIDLTISNQQDKPNSISRFLLLVKHKEGEQEELEPVSLSKPPEIKLPDDTTALEAPLYFQPHEAKTGKISFIYDESFLEQKDKTLYIFDDRDTPHLISISEDTMAKMAKKSFSRKEQYRIE